MFPWLLLAWSLGAALGWLSSCSQPLPLLVVAATALIASVAGRAVEARPCPRWVAPAALCGALFLGGARGAAAVHVPGPGTVDGHLGETVTITGTIDQSEAPGVPGGQVAAASQRLRLRAERLILTRGHGARDHGTPVEGVVLLTSRSAAPLWPGQRVQARGRLRPVARVSPGGLEGFDARLARQGVYAEMSGGAVTALGPPPSFSPVRVIEVLRRGLAWRTRFLLPEPEATLAMGEVAGLRGSLPAPVDAELVDSGLAHVLAISGIKVAIVAAMLSALAAAVAGRRAAPLAILGIALYAAVGGATASAIRSAAMGSLGLVARVARRDVDVHRALALAGAAMVGLDPAIVADPSFQYTFLGVAGIVLLAERVAARVAWVPRLAREAFALTVGAQLFTVPLTAHYFHVIPLLGPLTNALVLPTLPAEIVGGFVVGATGVLPPHLGVPIGSLAAAVMFVLARITLVVAHLAVQVPGAVISIRDFGPAATIAYYGGVAGMVLPLSALSRAGIAAGGAVLAAGVLVGAGVPDGHLHMTFPAGTTGLVVVVRAPDGARLLVDTGTSATALPAALDTALPPRLPGTASVDAVLLTGRSADESGGLDGLRDRVPGRVFATAPAMASLATLDTTPEVTTVMAGDVLRWHGLSLTLFPASADGSVGVIVSWNASRVVAVASRDTRSPPTVPSGPYDVVAIGRGGASPQLAGVTTRLVVAQDLSARVARGVVAWGDRLWRTTQRGSLELVCDAGGCRW